MKDGGGGAPLAAPVARPRASRVFRPLPIPAATGGRPRNRTEGIPPMPNVKVAILGCGGMAGAHARRFKSHPDVQIVALSDVDEPRVQSFIDRHLSDYPSKPAIFTDPAAMYAQAKPDAVVIVTPH